MRTNKYNPKNELLNHSETKKLMLGQCSMISEQRIWHIWILPLIHPLQVLVESQKSPLMNQMNMKKLGVAIVFHNLEEKKLAYYIGH